MDIYMYKHLQVSWSINVRYHLEKVVIKAIIISDNFIVENNIGLILSKQ